MDHLEPFGGEVPVPKYYYLAQFIEAPSLLEHGNYLAVLKTKDGRYVVRTGKFPVAKPLPKEPVTDTEVQISESFASVIYDLWVNAIFEVRYDRTDHAGFDGTSYIFSTFVNGLGWMHGGTWSPSGDAPPAWLVDAGSKLVAFAQDPKRNPKKTEAEIAAIREKLFGYIEKHGKH